MNEITQADHDAAEEHFNVWYPDTAWGYDALVDTLARHRKQATEALQADNALLREKIAKIADVVAIWSQPSLLAFPTRQRDPLDQATWDQLAKAVGEMADDALGKSALQETGQ